MLPLLLEPQKLAPFIEKMTGQADILLVDLCRDEVYEQYHIPGAVHVSPAELVSGERPAVGKLPDLKRLEALFSRIGYDPEQTIVAYDDEGGGWAGRFIWTLDVIGHKHSSYLNGGLHAWAAAELPMTQETPNTTAREVSLTINRAVIAEKEEVLASLDDPGVLIWDARSAEEYAGTKVVAARGGHIPGAINLDWLDLMDRHNHLQLHQDLPGILGAKGLADATTLITHCQTHHRSGLTYLVGKLLDLNIKAYHGSWSEWGNDPNTPIENPAEG